MSHTHIHIYNNIICIYIYIHGFSSCSKHRDDNCCCATNPLGLWLRCRLLERVAHCINPELGQLGAPRACSHLRKMGVEQTIEIHRFSEEVIYKLWISIYWRVMGEHDGKQVGYIYHRRKFRSETSDNMDS